MVNSFKKVIEMKRAMLFWKERKKIRLNGFGKRGGFLGNGIVKFACRSLR